jgi:uncharacterized membrane protein HdeD (DUF308 family)
MDYILLGFLLGFAFGLLLSIVLFCKDIKRLNGDGADFKEIVASLLFSTFQAGLSIAGIIAVRFALTTDNEPYWLKAVILCTLQLFVGTNVSFVSPSDGLMNSYDR